MRTSLRSTTANRSKCTSLQLSSGGNVANPSDILYRLQITAKLLSKYPLHLPNEEYNPLLTLLHQLQIKCKRYVYRLHNQPFPNRARNWVKSRTAMHQRIFYGSK